MKPVRLQKYLADAGVASRRKAEGLITAGGVRVNGTVVTELGTTVIPGTDSVTVGKRRVTPPQEKTVIAFFKPYGVVSTTKTGRERGTAVTQLVRSDARLFIAGRLDQDSEGLMILTNDGDLAQAIAHPRNEHEKEYIVKTQERVEPTKLRLFERGVRVGRERYTASRAWRSGEREFHIVLTTGHKHQIRRMADGARLTVIRLKRIRIGGLTLAGLQPGSSRELTPDEIQLLKRPKNQKK